MKNIVLITIIILNIFLSMPHVQSQSYSQEFINLYHEADYLLHGGDYWGALRILLELFEKDIGNMENPNINFLIGACYMNMNEFDKAHPFLLRALPHVSPLYTQLYSDNTASMFTHYYLGKINQIRYRFSEAIHHFNIFKYFLDSEHAESARYEELTRKIERAIEICHSAQRLIASPREILIENIGQPVNTKYPEYAPVISADGTTMFFTTRRPENVGERKDVDGKYFEDVYFATYNDSLEKWDNVQNMGRLVNTPGHEASVSISYDGKQLFLYKDDRGTGNLYVSRLINEQWSKPEKLTINSNHREAHVTLSPDGQTMIFSSDRPGGYGGLDLYKTVLMPGGQWSSPENLGPKINTPYDEDSPFILADGKTLFFASKGHENMGGYDMFTSEYDEETATWSKPANMGYPINTTEDDLFYHPTSDPNVFYYASSKHEGYGDMDIYRVKILEDVELMAIYRGSVFDEVFYRPVNAEFLLTDTVDGYTVNLTTYRNTGEYYTTLQVGRVYEVKIFAEGFDTITDYLNVSDFDRNQVFIEMYLMRKEGTTRAELEMAEREIEIEGLPEVVYFEDVTEVSIGDQIILRNIFFDFDRATLRPESMDELNKLIAFLEERPSLRIEISGHTDSRGSARYNQRLSEQRAHTVLKFLVVNGINPNRLEYMGYGFDRPIATNETEEGRQMNRRTEFRVVGL